MRYVSTRGGMPPTPFGGVLLEGLAPDGGLSVPERYPQVDASTLATWRSLDYPSLAFEIFSLYIDDIPPADLRDIVRRTYTAAIFGSTDITPLSTLEPGLHLLHLSNGPTLAFKDIAMQLLGNLFEYVLSQRGETLNILGATSGDTGSAAEYAMRGKRGIRVFMLSPNGKMSPFQTAQMYSLQDANIFNIAVEGVFDDCQDMVKDVSNDAAFKAKYRIGTVNSINWARLLAQVVYYFKGYFAATTSNDQRVSFSVPSGNFGNVCAGHVARMMGLPVDKLVVATNENDVLDVFFKTGRYAARPAADVVQTTSPSMDISKASNFERFVYDLVGCDPQRVAQMWREVNSGTGFDISQTPYFATIREFGFVSASSLHADRMRTIKSIFDRYHVTIDTHTADGVKAGLEHRAAAVPMICLETAQAVKFSGAIQEALGRVPAMPRGLEDLEQRPRRFIVMAPQTAAIKAYIAQHCEPR